MKKLFFMMGIAALMSISCMKENLPVEETLPEIEYNTVLKASISEAEKAAPAVKAIVSEDYKKLSWSAGDKISVYTSKGRFVEFIYDGTEAAETVHFKGMLDEGETMADFAVYPAGNHKVENGALKVNLPETYAWKKDQVNAVMTAALTGEDETVTFRHVGGVFAFDLKAVQAGVDRFTFSTSAGVTGDFDVEEGVINAAETASEVTFTFDALQQAADMKFFVPVPVGTYDGFTVTFYDGEETKSVRSSDLENKMERTGLTKFSFAAPGFIYVTANGSADADGSSWENAVTLTAALAGAVDGDVIRVAGGTYVPEALIGGAAGDAAVQYKTFHVRKCVTIQGSYNVTTGQIDTAATPTVISGKLSETENSYHAMVVAAPGAGKVVLRGLTFTEGAGKIMSADGKHNAELATGTTTSEDFEIKDFQGAGLYAASRVDVESCTFTANALDLVYNGTNPASGAGMMISATAKNSVVNRCSFTSNQAALAAGLSVRVTGTEVKNSYFSSNTAQYGGAYSNNQKATVANCNFVGNSATVDYAGAVRAFSTLTINDSDFIGNSCAGTGGAIQSNRQTVTINGCSFTGNTAKNGGAIANWGGGIMTVSGCEFSGNTASVNGGAIINMYQSGQSRSSKLTVTSCEFYGDGESDEKEAEYGGAIANEGAIAEVSGSTFSGLYATRGGAIYNGYSSVPSEMKLSSGNKFIGNDASYGGAIANEVSVMKIYSNEFTDNLAVNQGGAIASYDTAFSGTYTEVVEGEVAYLYIYNTLFKENKVTSRTTVSSGNQGGAIKIQGAGHAAVVNSTFTGSNSNVGAIRTRDGAAGTYKTKLWVVNSTFSENVSGLYNQNANFYIYNSILYGNTSNTANQQSGKDYVNNKTKFATTIFNTALGSLSYKNSSNTYYEVKNTLYNANGEKSTSEDNWTLLGTFNTTLGVFPVTGAPATTEGMAYATLAATGEGSLAAEITAVMPEFEAKYLTQDQKGNSREGKTIMGAYVGQ